MIQHSAKILFIFMSITQMLWASETDKYHQVPARSGDGVFTLLRRYHLADHEANVKQFYELNKLSSKAVLYKGKKYLLPVIIMKYNGKSIRSTMGHNDWDKAVRIKKYNEKLLRDGLRKTHYTASNILWVPYHETLQNYSASNSLSTKTKATVNNKHSNLRHYNLFGNKYKRLEIKDQRLHNRVYYIVSGHGGIDPGARCTECSNTLCEDEYAYDVALRLGRNLMQHGAHVEFIIQDSNDGIRDERYLPCDKDEHMEDGSALKAGQLARLNQRAYKVNKLYRQYQRKGAKEQMMITIHVDSQVKSKRQDVFFYHYPSSKSSKKLAHDIKNTFEEKYAYYQKNRDYKGYVDGRNLHVLRVTQPKAVLIELANIRNYNDHKRILLHQNRQALANWIYEGITRNVE